MPEIRIHQDKIADPSEIIKICPFGALETNDKGEVEVNSACKLCRICVKKGPEGAFEYFEEEIKPINKEEWKGIVVYVEHLGDSIHPVTYELLGKARELADKISHPVFALYIGKDISAKAETLYKYGADKVFVYDYPELEYFRIEPYSNCFEDFITNNQPSIILVGGTTIGRSLAPRVAARFHTGLTADCTFLDVQENSDLDQIRPAFGGNIMAHIRTPNHRPQFATVRYKIFNPLTECALPDFHEVIKCEISQEILQSRIEIQNVHPKEKAPSIEDAEYIIVAGRGVKSKDDLTLIKDFAQLIGAHFATTRPLIESGWADPKNQIGLSGRTVKPKLIITFGVSGSIQFRAGMQNSEKIIAVNTDPKANILDIAHYSVVGDLYKIIPILTEKVRTFQKEMC